MIEEWKPVVGFSSYEVSSHGRVRSLGIGRHTGTIRTPYALKKGHLVVDLYQCGERSKKYVHRLVLEAFVGPCPALCEGCHNDGDPSNNRLGNLRWDTTSSNWEDARRHGTARVRDTHHWSKLSSSDVSKILGMRSSGMLQREIAEAFGVRQWTIGYILKKAAQHGTN